MSRKEYPKKKEKKNRYYFGTFYYCFCYDIKESLSQLDQKTITKKMSICITYFKLKVIELVENIAIRKYKLGSIYDGEQLTFLQNKLQQFQEKLYKDLEKKKNKKLNKLSPSLSEISNTQ